MEPLHWKSDKAGDTLWRGETYLGCIYDRDGLASRAKKHGWRALEGEYLLPVGDVLPSQEEPDARMGARRLLEAHVSVCQPLLSAAELLAMT